DVVGDRVVSCHTSSDTRVQARWYVDASGAARCLARALAIPVSFYGRKKICLWTYFETPPLCEGTTFFLDNANTYLTWVWDIPISPTRTSVGCVLPADAVRAARRTG